MKYFLGLAALVMSLATVSRGADEENPFKKAKVGDWASYTMKTTAMGVNIDAEMKTTVTAKDDKEVTIKTSLLLNKMDIPGQESKIDLTKPYDPTSTANLPKDANAKVEKTGEGDEEIEVGGKKYACKWMEMKITAKIMNTDFESKVKVWMNKDVPLSGMVKMDMKSQISNMTMELKDKGSGK
ncbi:MAG: hypothetical protein K8T89_03755 [Planctomycetes bacterium]|nr:hypothetical protein [Planctomycetota bacterium]